ncbi:DUF6252 family protein [Pseudoflavitalea rhizosphaerae]|uniref:DUF6252 family protein n=1 Tax=Pseudoflavitalea rhizosphaerae TaxID=1884793 RepID=UPI000F8E095E|nr:DUF6252 family protein [Pseudoflavitalea rhizosphaerae]
MNRLLRMCLPVLMIFGLVSCLKEKSLDSTGDGGAGSLRMKIDGKQWTANKTASATIMNEHVTITGASQDNFDLMIQIKTTSVGTYQLDQASDHFAIVIDNNEASPVGYSTDQGANSSIAGGTVNITKIDEATKRMSGNFTFKLYRSIDDKSIMITEGVFENLPYTADPPTTGTGNSFKCKIDGTEWIAPQAGGALNQGVIGIVGTENATKTITISVPETIVPGDYPLDNTNIFYMAIYLNGNKAYGAGAGGTLKITEHQNRTIKGSFQFTAEDQANPPANPDVPITEGSFSVTY